MRDVNGPPAELDAWVADSYRRARERGVSDEAIRVSEVAAAYGQRHPERRGLFRVPARVLLAAGLEPMGRRPTTTPRPRGAGAPAGRTAAQRGHVAAGSDNDPPAEPTDEPDRARPRAGSLSSLSFPAVERGGVIA